MNNFRKERKMYYNQSVYENFDSDDNKKIFYNMYKEEFERTKSNLNDPITNENDFIKEINNSKVNDYYVYRNFSNYDNYDYVLKTKYINNYINFYNFNKHYNNPDNPNNQYGYYTGEKGSAYFVLNYNISYFSEESWRNHYKSVKETKKFIKEKNLKCSKIIENMLEDLEVLNNMREYYMKFQSSFKQIKDFEIFEEEFDEESKNIKNTIFLNNVIWNIKYNGIYISEKIKAQENSSKKISEKIEMIEDKLEKNNQRMLEIMGVFLAIFSIININIGKVSNDLSTNIDKNTDIVKILSIDIYIIIVINISIVACIIVLFWVIRKNDKNK